MINPDENMPPSLRTQSTFGRVLLAERMMPVQFKVMNMVLALFLMFAVLPGLSKIESRELLVHQIDMILLTGMIMFMCPLGAYLWFFQPCSAKDRAALSRDASRSTLVTQLMAQFRSKEIAIARCDARVLRKIAQQGGPAQQGGKPTREGGSP